MFAAAEVRAAAKADGDLTSRTSSILVEDIVGEPGEEEDEDGVFELALHAGRGGSGSSQRSWSWSEEGMDDLSQNRGCSEGSDRLSQPLL